ncbi:MAG TPA: DinB family protein [Pyrinomonadaceae bacterium]
MIQTAKWFEREFGFTLHVRMYPNVLERLRGTPARLADRLVALPPETLTRRDGDAWSMQEHAGHLLDLGALDIARLDDYAAGATMLRPADLQNRKTHAADHNANSIENILKEFRAERMEFVRRLEEFDESFIERTAIHPRLNQTMRVLDFAFFVAEHDDHHLARISDLIRRFDARANPR